MKNNPAKKVTEQSTAIPIDRLITERLFKNMPPESMKALAWAFKAANLGEKDGVKVAGEVNLGVGRSRDTAPSTRSHKFQNLPKNSAH
jgi:hypothetical protein